MKMVQRYEAFDGTEFKTMRECVLYEKEAWRALEYITERIVFLDEDDGEIDMFYSTIQEGLEKIDKAYQDCTYIEVLKTCDDDKPFAFIYNQLGVDLPKEVGRYEYLVSRSVGEWVKVE